MPRPFVLKLQSQASTCSVFDNLNRDDAAATVFQGVASQFTGSRDDAGLVDQTELQLLSFGSDSLSHEDEVFSGTNFHSLGLLRH